MQRVHIYLVLFAAIFTVLGFVIRAFYFEGRQLRNLKDEIARLRKELEENRLSRQARGAASQAVEADTRASEAASSGANGPGRTPVPPCVLSADAVQADTVRDSLEDKPEWQRRFDGILDALDKPESPAPK